MEVRYHWEDEYGEIFQFILREEGQDDYIFEWRNDEFAYMISNFRYQGGQVSEWDEYDKPDSDIYRKIINLMFEKELE